MSARGRIRIVALLVLVCFPLGLQAAASETECSIWLCVAQPATPECAAAMAASAKRTLQGESPVPSFGECDAGGDDHGLEIQTMIAARIGDEEPMRFALGECSLAENATIPGTTSPRGCTGTYRLWRILQHGRLLHPEQAVRIRGVPR